jgi:hypothetical protein
MILRKNKFEKADQRNTTTHTPQTNEIFGLRKFMHLQIMNLCVGYNQMGVLSPKHKDFTLCRSLNKSIENFPLVIKTPLIYIKIDALFAMVHP